MRRIDEESRRRFERHRLEGGSDPVEAFLPPGDAATRADTLEELVCIELEMRWKRRGGDDPAPSVAEYVRSHPILAEPERRERLEAENALLAQRLGRPGVASGTRIDAWVLREIVGRGAFAEVWRADDERLGRSVAIKIPHAGLAGDRPTHERVLREARSAAGLRHPNIVAVHEVGEQEGRPFIVSEFVAGPTLIEAASRRRFSEREAARIVADVATAVDYAHGRGIVHRDVKPGNILLSEDGRPMLTDFGLASLEAAGRLLTREGEVLGTPAYMAPEQARGETEAVGPRSDVYALGAVLYELIAGRAPFVETTTAATLYAVAHRDPAPPRRLRSAVPRDLETICLKAMAREPARRYESAGALRRDLERFLDRRPIRARRRGWAGLLLLWIQRNPRLAATIAIATVAIAAVAAVGISGVVAERDRYRRELHRALAGEAEALRTARSTDWQVRAMSRIAEAARLPMTGDARDALRALVARCVAVPEPSFRREAVWEAGEGAPTALAIEKGGRRFALLTESGALLLRDLDSGAVQWRRPDQGSAMTWAVAGPIVVGDAAGSLRLVDPATGEMIGAELRGAGPETAIIALARHPEGGRIAAARASGAIDLVRVEQDRLEPARRLDGHVGGTLCLAFSPDGTRLASGGADRMVRVQEWSSGTSVSRAAWLDPIRAVCWTDTGAAVAFAARETMRFGLLDPATGERRLDERLLHESAITALLAAPGGRIASVSDDGTLRLSSPGFAVEAQARPGLGAMRVAATDDAGLYVAGHADGRISRWRLARAPETHYFRTEHAAAFVPGTNCLLTDGGAVTYDGESAPRVVPPPTPAIRALAAHRASGRLTAIRDDGSWLCWEADDRRPRVHRLDEDLTALALLPDGRVAIGTAEGAIHVGHPGSLRRHDIGDEPVGAVAATGGELVARIGASLLRRDDAGAWEALPGAVDPAARLAAFSGGVAVAAPDGSIAHRAAPFAAPGRVIAGTGPGPTRIAASDAGSRLLVADGAGGMRLWEANPGHAPRLLDGLADAGAGWLALDEAGRLALAGRRLVDLERERTVALLAGRRPTCGVFDAHRGAAVLGFAGGAVVAWDLARVPRDAPNDAPTELLASDRILLPGGDVSTVWAIAVDPSGRWSVTTAHDGAVTLRDARSFAPMRVLQERGELAWTAAFSPEGDALAAGTGSTILVWDPLDASEPRTLEGHADLVRTLAWAPDGVHLVSGSKDGTVRRWNARTGAAAGRLDAGGRRVRALAFRADGAVAGAGSDGAVLLWERPEVDARPRVLPAPHGVAAWALAFDPQGRYLASGDQDGVVMLRDGRTFEPLVELRAEIRVVRGLSFGAGDRFLAAACYGGPSVTWDLDALRARLAGLGLDW